ncbi:hypothetical protein GHL01_00350 [Sinorhizobium meliloti]|uniref:hypothetical protein n=1 Tax=Rhizobium meliloti TaxID=382 RepID=UPI001296EBC7|nr:hypothetical protein [Sinorhizobium meliloti]MQV12195.1 hypothetical protein [Sinorhizobium meliloti]
MAWGDPYIALVDESEVFDPSVHCRFDLEVERVEFGVDSEDEFATFTIDVKPPTGGAYAPGKKTWAYLSYPHPNGTIYLLGKGKVDAFPLGGDPDSATLVFKCAPSDWQAAQLALLQTTKSEPHWDDVLVAPDSRDDPTEILDGQSRVIAFHPATHAVELHDIFGVGLDVIDFGDEWYDDSLSAELTGPAITEVEVEVTAAWKQQLKGTVFAAAAVTSAFGGTPSTLTPEDFENRWPRVGDGIANANGYTVRSSRLTRAYPVGAPEKAGPFSGSSDHYQYITDSNLTAKEARDVELDIAYFDHDLSLSWEAEQARREVVKIILRSGVQDTSLGNGGRQKIAVDCQDVTVDYQTPEWQPSTYYAVGALVRQGSANWRRAVAGVSDATWSNDFTSFDMGTFPPTLVQNWNREPSDQSPIGGIHNDRYLPTVRGHQTLLAAAFKGRAILADSMRNGRITVEVPLEVAIAAGLWIGKVARFSIPEGRLAIEGSYVQGKVVSYKMIISADDSDHTCSITIACALGSDKSTVAPVGTVSGTLTGEAWDVVALPSIAALLPRPMAVGGIVRARVEHAFNDQVAYVDAHDYDPPAGRTDDDATDPSKLLSDVPTNLILDLVSLASEDEMILETEIVSSIPFEGPKQIDLGGT